MGRSAQKAAYGKYDFSDFITIEQSVGRQTALRASIMSDGSFRVNSRLLAHFPGKMAEIRIKGDCSQIVLLLEGDKKIPLGKNGRTKKHDLIKRIKEKKVKLPASYVGEWDEEAKVWLGSIEKNL